MYDSIFIMPRGIHTRWTSAENPAGEPGAGGKAKGGRKGRECVPLEPGEQLVLADIEGSGTVRRMWFTITDTSPEMLRGLKLDFFWDNAPTPAVSAPFGDFFGNGLGRMAVFENALFANPEGRSFNCYLPMPFKKRMRLLVTNESGKKLEQIYYDVDFTLGDRHGEDILYFHAHFRHENPTTLKEDYQILPLVKGRGRFIGSNLGIIATGPENFGSWWGEGECKIYIDGDGRYPTLCGTGTEDYIGTAWGLGRFTGMYQGCTLADFEKQQYCIYRYHLPDPVYFYRDIRVTIQQLGCWGPGLREKMYESGNVYYHADEGWTPADLSPGSGVPEYGLYERQDDWSGCAYFYLDAPENGLPPIEPLEMRLKGLL